MTGSTHFAAGLLTGLYIALNENTGMETTIMIMTIAGLASLLPDIDLPGSTISELLKPVSKIYNWLESKLMPKGMQHRGITHTAIIPLLAVVYWWAWNPSLILLSAIAGYVSHIVLDCFTKAGAPLIYPITSKRLGFGMIDTGSETEETVNMAIWCLMLFMFWDSTGIKISDIVAVAEAFGK